jgi:hypothetical protein
MLSVLLIPHREVVALLRCDFTAELVRCLFFFGSSTKKGFPHGPLLLALKSDRIGIFPTMDA